MRVAQNPLFSRRKPSHHHIHKIERESRPDFVAAAPPPHTQRRFLQETGRAEIWWSGRGRREHSGTPLLNEHSGHRDRLGHRRYEADRRAGGGENLTRVSSLGFILFVRAAAPNAGSAALRKTQANAQRLGALVRKKHSRSACLALFCFLVGAESTMASKRIQKELQVRSRLPWPPWPPFALPARVTKGRRRPDPEARGDRGPIPKTVTVSAHRVRC